MVTDKGHHSNDALRNFDELELCKYCSEPDHRHGNWQGQNGVENQFMVYANRRRIRSERGKRLLVRRGEFLERTFEYRYETGARRPLHVRGDANIMKRLLLQAVAFNLSLVMRKQFKAGTPRGYGDLVAALCRAMSLVWTPIRAFQTIL